jgi:hypothetical protein
MADFALTPAVYQKIIGVVTPHIKALNDDLTPLFPDAPDMAYTIAVGQIISVLIRSAKPDDRQKVADGLNIPLKLADLPWRVVLPD